MHQYAIFCQNQLNGFGDITIFFHFYPPSWIFKISNFSSRSMKKLQK